MTVSAAASGGCVSLKGVETNSVRHYYDGDRVIAEESDLRGVRRLVPGDRGLDEVVQVKDLSATYWLHTDDQLSVMAVTDDTGAVIERYEYRDYGERQIFDATGLVPRAVSTLDLEIGFSGGRLDDESGLYYLRARYLHPSVGRFISRDPLGMWGDAVSLGNGMQYAGANPWTWSDPSGLYAIGGGDGAMWNPRPWSPMDRFHVEARPCYQDAEGATNGQTEGEATEKPEEKGQEDQSEIRKQFERGNAWLNSKVYGGAAAVLDFVSGGMEAAAVAEAAFQPNADVSTGDADVDLALNDTINKSHQQQKEIVAPVAGRVARFTAWIVAIALAAEEGFASGRDFLRIGDLKPLPDAAHSTPRRYLSELSIGVRIAGA